ncbi:hypothetical protein L1887_55130 [Cichorium endivia]|nr:hypothetical protein L1887_55130 [Cichorium endivia]
MPKAKGGKLTQKLLKPTSFRQHRGLSNKESLARRSRIPAKEITIKVEIPTLRPLLRLWYKPYTHRANYALEWLENLVGLTSEKVQENLRKTGENLQNFLRFFWTWPKSDFRKSSEKICRFSADLSEDFG